MLSAVSGSILARLYDTTSHVPPPTTDLLVTEDIVGVNSLSARVKEVPFCELSVTIQKNGCVAIPKREEVIRELQQPPPPQALAPKRDCLHYRLQYQPGVQFS